MIPQKQSTIPFAGIFRAKAGFTLVEITISVGILATVLVVTIALLSPGLEAGKRSASQTITGVILEDVHERMEGQELVEGDLPNSPYFYDDQGMFIDSNARTEILERRVYRAEARVVEPSGDSVFDHTSGMKGVIIDLYWPVNPETGEVYNDEGPGTSVTYYMTTLTGPDWTRVDPSFVPKFEF